MLTRTRKFPFHGGTAAVTLLLVSLSMSLPEATGANPDVYGVLPADTRVLQYSLADLDGDGRGELVLLYTAAGETRLTVFRADSGRWTRWSDGSEGVLRRQDGSFPESMETADTNGDGTAEVLAYYLAGNRTAMAARILSLDAKDPANPFFRTILEDMTAPPGYPLLGTEESARSVTFMRMATAEEDGFRRVYCWDGERFEVCEEVVWEKP